MAADRKYKAVVQPLSAEDKVFIKLVSEGMKKTHAFRAAYPNHKSVMRYLDAVKDQEDAWVRQRAAILVTMAAKNKLQTQRMQKALVTYQSKMKMFSEFAVDTAIELVQHAKSEKVRSDLAIEGMRHEVGAPVTKVQIQEDKTVVLTFGDQKPERTPVEVRDTSHVPEAQVVPEHQVIEVQQPTDPLEGIFNPDFADRV